MRVHATGWSRRRFTGAAAAALCAPRLLVGQTPLPHANVLTLERERILADAAAALQAPVSTITSVAAPKTVGASSANEFVSEAEPDLKTAGDDPPASLFTAHATLLRDFSRNVAHLTAGLMATQDERYAKRAGEHLRAWFLDAKTRMNPEPQLAGCRPGQSKTSPAGVVDLVPLAEIARACSFLVGGPETEVSAAFEDTEWKAVHAWFGTLLAWMDEDREAAVARDAKDHRGSAWLLIAGAVSRFQRNDSVLEATRKRFRAPTLRNQIRNDGSFPAEVATSNPYRNTLFNFDLLATACQVLSSPFDLLWSYELIDGVGMRSCTSFLYPVIAHPERWPYLADAHDFRQMPGRRPALLFAGRAFDRPEYIELWRSTPPGPVLPGLAYSYPICEPVLWTARAPHGL